MRYVELLQQLHERLQPRAYLQLGLSRPELMTNARCGVVGLDTAPRVEAGAHVGKPWLKIYAMDRDAFFATEQPEHLLEGEPLDLVVIEGDRTLPEIARDISYVTQWAHPGTYAVIVTDDA